MHPMVFTAPSYRDGWATMQTKSDRFAEEMGHLPRYFPESPSASRSFVGNEFRDFYVVGLWKHVKNVQPRDDN